MFDLDQLKRAEMFAATLTEKLEKLRIEVEKGAPSPHMVRGELDSAEQITQHIQKMLKAVG